MIRDYFLILTEVVGFSKAILYITTIILFYVLSILTTALIVKYLISKRQESRGSKC